MHRIRGNLTYSNVISTLCLVLLVGGGTAYAASELGKESVGTKQLVKGAVTPAKLSKAAKKKMTGPKGATGQQGPQGPKGDKGEKGDRGEPGPAIEILPSGRTETGAWGAAADNGNFGIAPINFVPKLPASVPLSHEKYLEVGAPFTVECPGFEKAAPGFLCVYAVSNYHMAQSTFNNPGQVGNQEASVNGVVIYFSSTAQEGNTLGDWAYTAP